MICKILFYVYVVYLLVWIINYHLHISGGRLSYQGDLILQSCRLFKQPQCHVCKYKSFHAYRFVFFSNVTRTSFNELHTFYVNQSLLNQLIWSSHQYLLAVKRNQQANYRKFWPPPSTPSSVCCPEHYHALLFSTITDKCLSHLIKI